MKALLVSAVLIFWVTICKAQAPHAGVYIHALYATPLDNSSQTLYNEGAGGVAGILVGKGTTRFNASIGYSHFFADNSNALGDETYVPVKIGIRQYIPFTLHFLYVQGNMGVGFVNHENGDNYSPFAFNFGAGVKFTAFEAALIWDNFHEKH